MLSELKNIAPEKAAIIEAYLPESARNFLRIIGFEATIALVREFGGCELRLTKKAKSNSSTYAMIAKLIGVEKTDAFFAEYAGEVELYIPRCQRAMNALKALTIIRAYDDLTRSVSGRKAVDTLAKQFHMSGRSIEKIVNGETPAAKNIGAVA